jgi:methyl-galactoside transport system permease protein
VLEHVTSAVIRGIGMNDKGILSHCTGALRFRWQSYKELESREKLAWWGDFLVRNAIYIIIAMVVIYVQIYSIQNNFSNTFLSLRSIIDILKRAASGLFLALGVGGIIVLTGTDLSAGRIMGLTACICASLLQMPLEQYGAKMFPP